MTGISWDYEESTTSYYHIYASYGVLDGKMDAICLEIPRTDENDLYIAEIVVALRKIESRLKK